MEGVHFDGGGQGQGVGVGQQGLAHLGQAARAGDVVGRVGDMAVEVLTPRPGDAEEVGGLERRFTADAGDQQLEGRLVVQAGAEVDPGAAFQEGTDALRVGAGQ